MREIKFRAWDKANKKMHYDVGILGSAIYIDFNGQKEYEEVNGHELMQYTGAKDKNGREIYEGDVIKIWPDDYDCETAGYVVKCEGCYWIRAKDDNSISMPLFDYFNGIMELEVIGNIYENPELLGADVHVN